MKRIFCVGLILFWVATAQAQRNTILIIADDLGTDYFGFFEDHQDTVDVPNIRALLSKGVRFKNVMSYPVCSSTRAGILTGRYSFRTGVGNIVGGTGGSGPLDTAEISIPKLLKIYNPAIAKANIGKWHLLPAAPAINLVSPLALGYNHSEGPFIGQLPSFTNWTKYTDGVTSTVTNYATSENVDNAITWLNQQGNNPFFLWLAFNAPHEPLHLPPANLHTYNTLSGTQGDINQNPKPYFKAMIQAMDTEIGRLFSMLQTAGKLDSTDIIFIGDNGNTKRTAQITNLDRAKGTVYQYGVHVPMIIAGPSVVNPGRASDALVNTADIFATVLDLFGYTNWQAQIPNNKPVDSKSMLPIIKNVSTQVRPWAFSEIFKLTPDSADGKAMRNMDYKLIRFDYGHEEFYNLATDPNEDVNLLNGTMSATDIINYNYLCNEMTTLVGNGQFCEPLAITEQPVNYSPAAFPNPFTSHITINAKDAGQQFQLSTITGQVIYSGKNIDKQDFSSIAKGIYLLKAMDKSNRITKLIKE